MFIRKIIVCFTVSVLFSTQFLYGFKVLNTESSADVDKYLVFRLYTRNQSEVPQEIKPDTLQSTPIISFDSRLPTRIFNHGFKSKEKVIIRYKNAYLKLGDYNFIGVDWTEGAKTYNYYWAKSCVGPISTKLAELIVVLVGEHGMNECIIGLDPASVGFSKLKPENRLDVTDADYVQVIHTDTDKFGITEPIGHADFYPNSGQNQPGCPKRNAIMKWFEKCSHVRVHHLFLESLETKFPAIQCKSFEDLTNGICAFSGTVGAMGGDITAATEPKPHGVFYLETKPESPYVISEYTKFEGNSTRIRWSR